MNSPYLLKYSANDVLDAIVLNAVCHRCRCVSANPGVTIFPLTSIISASSGRDVVFWEAGNIDLISFPEMRTEVSRSTFGFCVVASKDIIVPPERRIFAQEMKVKELEAAMRMLALTILSYACGRV